MSKSVLFSFQAGNRRVAVLVLSGAALTLASALTAHSAGVPPEPVQDPGKPLTFVGTHITMRRASPQDGQADAAQAELAAEKEESDEAALSPPAMAPTRSSFLATWKSVPGATGYQVDVSTDRTFARYERLQTGRVTFRIVSELQPNTTYYYRVRSFNASGESNHGETMSAATSDSPGLVIAPTYDASVDGSAKAAAIQGMVSTVIALYQSLFKDPITARILFRYANTGPDGSLLGTSIVARSDTLFYSEPWGTCISKLKADASTQNDATANASLPPTALSASITLASANGRAIGLVTPPKPFSSGVGYGLAYDGIVTFNSAVPLRYVRPAVSGFYDAQAAAEHEIDEVLGVGSHLNASAAPSPDLRPQDLFSWTAPHIRNTKSTGTRYLSIDPGVTKIVDLNQNHAGDLGDWLSPDCPNPYPQVQDAFACPGQLANVTASSPEARNLDVIGYDLDTSTLGPAALGNISTRLKVESGDDVLIGGFIVAGSQPKQVLLRALGPSLSLPGALADPTLELHSTDALIASNDNWQSEQKAEIIATGIPPASANESAIVATLDPGAYTAIVKGAAGGHGLALIEVYDLDGTSDSNLPNISTRGVVGKDDNVLIGGFIILGGESARVLMRALGPSLPVSGTLTDPTLELHDGNGMVIASNGDWRSDQEFAIQATGLPPTRDAESAIVSTLAPGSYTAIVRGKDNSTGVGLVEVYRLSE